MATKKRAAKKKVEVDWSDEDSVLAAMAVALECDPSDLTIEEDKGMGSFREGTVYRVEQGRQEYFVAENDDAAHSLAVAIVKQDLEESPENFEQNFIQSHINLDRLRRDLHSDVQSSIYDSLLEDAKRDPMRFFKDNSIDIPEPTHKQMMEYAEAMEDEETTADVIVDNLKNKGDAEDRWIEMGEEPEVPDSEVERIAEESADEQLKDPVAYLTDMQGESEGIKQAIEIGGIDVDAAAEEAVSTDGEGHFLSGYDGNINDGPGGIVWWQGKRRSAQQAAKAEKIAEEHGWRFEWEHDPEPYEMGDAETEAPDEVLTCVLYDENGEVLASLGGIGMSGTQRERKDYGRIIEAELAMEGASNKGLL